MNAPRDNAPVDLLIVGAGFSGMYLVHRCRSLGLSCVVLEQGDDVGGTWYWNRYPGARCDIPTIEYSYSFDKALEAEWDWRELMATQPEILDYANHVADRYDVRRDMRFGQRVTAAEFDDDAAAWHVHTEKGDAWTARFLILATGCLSVPNWPDLPGRDTFAGDVYHTGLWPHDPVDFSGLDVGIIGTGSSAVQSIPEIARDAKSLTVFQRTPVYTFPAGNHPLDDSFRADIRSHYDELRDTQRHSLGGMARYGVMGRLQEMGSDNILDLTPQQRRDKLDAEGLPSLRRYPDVASDMTANAVAVELYCDYVRSVVEDPVTAAALMPREHPLGCKRQVVDIGYYETFNRDNVTLVDLRQDPLRQVTPTGIDTETESWQFDALVYATGFDAMTGAINNIDLRSGCGRRLADKWRAGPRTYLGLATAGFPNLFMVTGPGSPSVLSNMLVSIEQHCDWITECVNWMNTAGKTRIEPDPLAEDAWVAHVNQVAAGTMLTADSCNSWYLGANIPGKTRVFMPYVGGVGNYRDKCDAIAAAGYEGFTTN